MLLKNVSMIDKETANRASHFRTTMFVLLLILTASCTNYTNIPKSDWDSTSSDAAKQWEIKTSTTIYRVHRFVVTDSTIVLEDATRLDKNNYPANSFESIDNSELPIVLPLDDVVSIHGLERSSGQTFVLGTIVGGVVIGVGLVLLFAHSMPDSD